MLLVCAAWHEELKYIETQANTIVEALGIGYLDAALKLDTILKQNKNIDEILFLGTCGSYNQNLKIAELVHISNVSMLERGEIMGLAYNIEKRKGMNYDSGDKGIPCLCSLEITNSEHLSKQILDYYGYTTAVENMELFGVAKVADEHQIKWRSILGVTNYTNLSAHQDWLAQHSVVSQALATAGIDFGSKSLLY